MALTESEVQALVERVGEVDMRDPDVMAWVKDNLKSLGVEERRLKAAFAFHRLLRNDDAMQAIGVDLERARKSLTVLNEMLAEG